MGSLFTLNNPDSSQVTTANRTPKGAVARDSVSAHQANTGARISTEEIERMARRRFQDPKPRIEGRFWYLRFWQNTPGVARKRERIKLAPASMPEREVLKIAAERLRLVNRGLITVGSTVNFMTYVEDTYIPTELPLLAKGVQGTYRGAIRKHLEPVFGGCMLRDLTPLTLQRFFSAMPARGISYPTMVKVRDALSSVLRSAVRFEFLEGNPLEKLQLPPDKRGRLIKPVISPAEFQSLLLLIPEPYASMVYVAAYTGLRISELAALKWENIGEGSISVAARFSKGDWSCTKTQASAAPVAVASHVLDRIRRLKDLTVDVRAGRAMRHLKVVKRSAPEDLVFQSVWRGGEINADNIRKRFSQPAAEKLNLGVVNWRCLRTSCATWQLQAGADPKSVQGQMRHSRISTTMDIYAQFVPEGQKRAAAKLTRYVADQVKKSRLGPKPWSDLVQ
jgi:integrase